MNVRSAAPLVLIIVLASDVMALAQTDATGASKPKNEGQMGGVSTGGTYAPVKDEKNRPITAGGFGDGAPVIFEGATQKSGLAAFQHVSGTPEKKYIQEGPASAVPILDYHNTAHPPIYLLYHSPLHPLT